MPNIVAYIALIIWPILTIFFIKRNGFQKGLILSLLGSYMFLPAAFSIDFPGIPAINKYNITSLTFILYMLVTGKRFGINSLSILLKLILLGFLLSPFLSAVTNKESYLFIPGITLYDGLSQSVDNFLYIFPFIVGARYFRTFDSQIIVFKYFSIAAIIYAIFAFYEIRMSPQLHTQVYGYFPHEWIQQYRQGGFRAVVFIGHGLLVALFLSLGFAFLLTLHKTRIRILPIKNGILVLFLLAAVIFSKTLSALLFAIFVYVMLIYAGSKLVHKATIAIMALVITYPLLSITNTFPHNKIISYASMISEPRAESLEFRFKHEKMLLEHAKNKPLFGWGSWGRNRIYDPETGKDLSVTDGKWIVVFGTRGWFGFLIEFAFIVITIIVAYKAQQRIPIKNRQESIVLAGHALIVSLIMLDQIPNTSIVPLYWFVIGCLLGRSDELNKDSRIKFKEE
jgi:O-antigen ligase/polysaccharide polymerase Wzy-like membrane protein